MPKVADFIEQHRTRLIQRFAEEASRLESARTLQPQQVIDTLPAFLDQLVRLSRQGRRDAADPMLRRLEESHVRMRLRMGYPQDEVTKEYVLLGRLIASLWEDVPHAEQPSAEDTQLLFDALDAAMDDAVTLSTGISVEARQREKRALRLLDALAPKTLGRDEGLGERVAPLVAAVQEAMGADGAELLLVDASGRMLELAAATGRCPAPSGLSAVAVDGPSFVARAAKSEEPVVLTKVSEGPLEVREDVCTSGLRTLMGLRLQPHGALLGVLTIGVTEARPFEPRAKRLFETLVESLSGILDRALLFGLVQRTQEQLLHSQARYRLASEAVADAIWDWDLTTDAVDWSVGVQKLFGYTPEELGPDIRGWSEHIHPEDRERVTHGLHAVIGGTGARWQDEYRFRHRDGRYVRVTDHGLVERDARGKGVRMVGAMQDVTAQRSAQESLRDSEERLSLALDAADMGTWDLDVVTGRLRWDAHTRAHLAFSPDGEVTFDTFLDRVHPDDRERVRARMEAALDPAGSGRYESEFRTVSLPGVVERWLQSTGRALFEGGRAVRVVGTNRDISALKAAQDALARREREFRTLAEAMPQHVWTAQPDGRVDYINLRRLEYAGRPVEELLGSGWLDIFHPDDMPRAMAAWRQAVASGEPYELEGRIRRHDGVYRWQLSRAVAVRDEQGRVLKWLGTSTDIEDLKRAEAELRRRAEFEQQLVGIVSHDLRNPLNAILLSAQVLPRSGALTEEQARTVARLRSAAERAARMTRDLLDFTQARLGGGIPVERAPLDFHTAVRKVLDEVRLAHPDRTLELVSSGNGQGILDEDRLAQVITNLVNNALAYSPAGSPVRVETRGEDGALLLSIHNQGEPIPPDVLPQLFEPMRRGTDHGGTAGNVGLGLFIVKSIVEAHGGTVEVRSTAEEGTTFLVRLPRRPGGESAGGPGRDGG
jgi:PAS domain S-box-containing protein